MNVFVKMPLVSIYLFYYSCFGHYEVSTIKHSMLQNEPNMLVENQKNEATFRLCLYIFLWQLVSYFSEALYKSSFHDNFKVLKVFFCTIYGYQQARLARLMMLIRKVKFNDGQIHLLCLWILFIAFLIQFFFNLLHEE